MESFNASEPHSERLQVSPEVARLLSPETSDIIRLRAVHGQMALSETDQVMLWFLVLSGDSSRELKNEALTALRQATPAGLKPVLKDRTLHPRVLDFLLRARYNDLPVVIFLRSNPSVPQRSWLAIFQRCSYEILSFFFSDQAPFKLSNDELKAARSNPQTTEVLQAHIDQQLSI
ncbi:MAG: hypothetical protein JXR59_10345, partial [Desulfuromonadaceae bacterium]|nr:hypothetical protein [Desulfuromonadaceae bacterium]